MKWWAYLRGAMKRLVVLQRRVWLFETLLWPALLLLALSGAVAWRVSRQRRSVIMNDLPESQHDAPILGG